MRELSLMRPEVPVEQTWCILGAHKIIGEFCSKATYKAGVAALAQQPVAELQ
jgi:hypothetical protein